MKFLPLGRWVVLLFSLITLVLFPVKVADACSGLNYYTFLDQSLVTPSIYTPFTLMSFSEFHFPSMKDEQQNQNIAEWIGRFDCYSIQKEDVFQVIYKTPVDELVELRAATINKKLELPINLHGNTFAEAIQDLGCSEIANYLIFAKECEPFVLTPKNKWKKEDKDFDSIHDLMKKGGKLFKRTDSHFVRLRLAYQVIRLAHYTQQYRKVLELRDYFLPKIDKINSIINWWILGHVAGAELKLGKKVDAAYHFAQIFQNSPAKRTSAFNSFHIDNDEQWGKVIIKCQSNDEKANLYAIRAAHARSRVIDEMQAIYRLSPQHPSLEPLLIKIIKSLEKAYLKAEIKDKHVSPAQRRTMKSTQQLIDTALSEKKVNHPIIWQIAKGYLLLLEGNWPEAELLFNKVETEDPKLAYQIETIKTLTQIKSYQKADTETESNIYNIMLNSDIYKQNIKLRAYIKERMAYLYAHDTLIGKSTLMKYGMDDLKCIHDIVVIDELIDVTEKEMPTRLEKLLITKPDGTSIRSELLEIKATLLLAQGRVETAKEVIGLIPRAERSTKRFSPFVEDFRDCVFCPVTDTTAYTKDELIDKLVEYEYRARADIENGPDYFYLLGNAWYNISYFGSAWQAADYFRSGRNWHFRYDDIYPYSKTTFGNKENHNLSKARLYFSKALELGKSKELQARAAFMLARIDQKEWFLSPNCPYKYQRKTNLIPKLPYDRMVYYNLLVKEYQDTEFYEQIIEECLFFRAYAQ